jgi:hypothetical protein
MGSSCFSWALRQVKAGMKIKREGWNGKEQFVVFQKGYPEGIAINANTSEAFGLPQGTILKFDPYLAIKNQQGSVVPWLASQGDLLATDWIAF